MFRSEMNETDQLKKLPVEVLEFFLEVIKRKENQHELLINQKD